MLSMCGQPMAVRCRGGKHDCARPKLSISTRATKGRANVAQLSISKAWDETRETLARSGKLMGAVAAAMVLLPQVVVGVVTGQAADASNPGLTAGILMVIAGIIGIVG